MKLAIISHTEHYKTSDGAIVGWSSTVNEINHLLDVFDEIYHIAMLHEGEPPPSVMAYKSDRIKFVPLKPSGGKTILSKFNTILNAPSVIKRVSKTMKKVDCFQLRAPTGIAVYLIPYLTFFTKKKGWYKYAGNWNQEQPPLGYALQRYMLKKQARTVTINGEWDNQPKQCLTFENPCLAIEDLELGKEIIQQKTIDGKLIFCFVGRLEKEKGVETIIKACALLTDVEKERIDKIHFVGSGFEINYFKSLASTIKNIEFVFHGFLSRTEVFNIYKASHLFLLPSTASEGFPKVIAEAMNFGCIPMVSNVSSIGQYVNQNNGYILHSITVENLALQLKKVIYLSNSDFKNKINSNKILCYKFSFEHYNNRIRTLLNMI